LERAGHALERTVAVAMLSRRPVISENPAEDLAALGLNQKDLSDAVNAGELARRGCTANDPPTAPGYSAWSRVVRTLRELNLANGWTKSDAGLSTIISPTGEVAIAVAAGDAFTGTEKTPSTKYPKGSATQEAVEANQLDLFPSAKKQRKGARTWILLVHATATEVRSELSLPESIDGAGFVRTWMR
jgi:hypothetical protein